MADKFFQFRYEIKKKNNKTQQLFCLQNGPQWQSDLERRDKILGKWFQFCKCVKTKICVCILVCGFRTHTQFVVVGVVAADASLFDLYVVPFRFALTSVTLPFSSFNFNSVSYIQFCNQYKSQG